mmetsp:Transcript_51592/g.96720  ORF Transcript_51592/g.96720 Transcript_51592/m.96720 type:complete len:85 (+) Transcript_51592:312-566(+)
MEANLGCSARSQRLLLCSILVVVELFFERPVQLAVSRIAASTWFQEDQEQEQYHQHAIRVVEQEEEEQDEEHAICVFYHAIRAV